MLQSHKIRNPFSLLDEDDDVADYRYRKVERQIVETKPIKKAGHMPFAKFDIKHQAKPVKQQPVAHKQNKEAQKMKQTTTKKQQHADKKSQVKSQLKQQQHKKDNQQKHQIKQQQSTISNDQSQEDEDKKYFLTKKIRQIKYQLNEDGDPPLLYDIGLEPEMIKDKLRLVLKMGEPDYDMIMNPDLAGPIAIAFAFGFLLLFSGQIQFGDIYALFIIGNLFLFVLFNFMSQSGVISLYNIMSILGYCLLPMLLLGMVGIFLHLNTGMGLTFSLLISLWSSAAGGNFIEALLRGKRNRKGLIMYPLFLFYSSFAMMVIF